LQQAQEAGALRFRLGHFEKLNIRAPEAITVAAELDEGMGVSLLTPQMGQAASHEKNPESA
jgi:hypothetical protein